MMPMNEALLAHSVPSLGTESAIMRVNVITDATALEYAEGMEKALNGRSAVLEAIARRRTEIRVGITN